MKRTSIDLSDPFDSVLKQALSLPIGGDDDRFGDAQMDLALRALYAAANGTAVATPIGSIPIAPAIAPWLKTAPLAVRTRRDLFIMAGWGSDLGAGGSS